MYCLRTREAFHTTGHGRGRRHLSEMQRRLLSGAVAHYAAHSARKSLASWRTSLVASELLPLQICGDFGELGKSGFEVFDNFLRNHIGIGKMALSSSDSSLSQSRA